MSNNIPLDDDGKLTIKMFMLMMVLGSMLLFAIIPSIIILFCVYKADNRQDFSYIEAAYKYAKIYFLFLIFLAIGSAIFYSLKYFEPDGFRIFDDGRVGGFLYDGEILLSVIVLAFTMMYLFFLHALFYKPLLSHRDWISENGIFVSAETDDKSETEKVCDKEIIKPIQNLNKTNTIRHRFTGFAVLLACLPLGLYAIEISSLINITLPGANESTEILTAIVQAAIIGIPFLGALAGLVTLITGDISHIKDFFNYLFGKNNKK